MFILNVPQREFINYLTHAVEKKSAHLAPLTVSRWVLLITGQGQISLPLESAHMNTLAETENKSFWSSSDTTCLSIKYPSDPLLMEGKPDKPIEDTDSDASPYVDVSSSDENTCDTNDSDKVLDRNTNDSDVDLVHECSELPLEVCAKELWNCLPRRGTSVYWVPPIKELN